MSQNELKQRILALVAAMNANRCTNARQMNRWNRDHKEWQALIKRLDFHVVK